MIRRQGMGGFTIVETLIFLSVSGFVFIGAIGGYTQRQRQVEFSQGVRDFQAQLQDLASDVSSGYYPATTSKCRANADPSNPQPFFNTTPAASADCVWLGKAIQLGTRARCTASAPAEDCNRYVSFPIIGRRDYVSPNGDKTPVSNFTQARPVALNTCLIGMFTPCESRPNLSDEGRLQGGIGIYRVFVRASATGGIAQQTGAIAFMSALQDNGAGRTGKASAIDLVFVPGTNVQNEEVIVTNIIDTGLNTSHVNPPFGVTFCIKGAHDQRGSITVGAERRTLDVVVQPEDRIDTGC